jgi:hypothetical protein
LALLVAACGGTTAPESVSALSGIWQVTPTEVGQGFICMGLTPQGSAVKGIGFFAPEESPHDIYFAVSGGPTQVVFSFPGVKPAIAPATYTVAQTDADHLQLTGAGGNYTFERTSSPADPLCR